MEHTGFIMTAPQDFVVTHELAHEWWYALISQRPGAGAVARRGVRLLRRGGGGRPAASRGARAPARGRASSRAARRGSARTTSTATGSSTPRAPACSTCCASGWAAPASARRCARTPTPTATAGRPGRSSARRWTPPRRSRSATSGAATASAESAPQDERPAGRRGDPDLASRSRPPPCCRTWSSAVELTVLPSSSESAVSRSATRAALLCTQSSPSPTSGAVGAVADGPLPDDARPSRRRAAPRSRRSATSRSSPSGIIAVLGWIAGRMLAVSRAGQRIQAADRAVGVEHPERVLAEGEVLGLAGRRRRRHVPERLPRARVQAQRAPRGDGPHRAVGGEHGSRATKGLPSGRAQRDPAADGVRRRVDPPQPRRRGVGRPQLARRRASRGGSTRS